MLMRVQKRTTETETAFNDWWSAQSSDFKAIHNMDELLRGFKAGFTAGRRKKVRRFTFTAGKMRVTVWAANQATAKAMAMREADRRAQAIGISPPKAGWTLRIVGIAAP